MKDKIIEIINFSCEHFVAIPLKCKKRLADELLALFDSETKEQNQVIEILKGHVDSLQEQLAKRDELIKMISPHGAEFWGSDSDKYLRLTNDIASLKSQLAEAGEEKRNKLIKAYSDLVIEIDKHKGTTIKEIKLRNKIANLKLEIR